MKAIIYNGLDARAEAILENFESHFNVYECGRLVISASNYDRELKIYDDDCLLIEMSHDEARRMRDILTRALDKLDDASNEHAS